MLGLGGLGRWREASRKLIHSLGILIVPALHIASRGELLAGLLGCLAISAMLELVRLKWPRWLPFKGVFNALLREHERGRPAGYLYFFASTSLIVALASRRAASFAIASFIAGDVASAIAGTYIGRRRIVDYKTVEGVVCGAIAIALTGAIYPPSLSLSSAALFIALELIAGLVEVDDNLLHPLALALWAEAFYTIAS